MQEIFEMLLTATETVLDTTPLYLTLSPGGAEKSTLDLKSRVLFVTGIYAFSFGFTKE